VIRFLGDADELGGDPWSRLDQKQIGLNPNSDSMSGYLQTIAAFALPLGTFRSTCAVSDRRLRIKIRPRYVRHTGLLVSIWRIDMLLPERDSQHVCYVDPV
jgi:hypothetical protein